jgi:hypothetical protein
MTDLSIPNELAERLHAIAQREQRQIEEVLSDLVAQYEARGAESSSQNLSRTEALAAMKGMFDDEVTDLSSTVRETMSDYYRNKYGRSD